MGLAGARLRRKEAFRLLEDGAGAEEAADRIARAGCAQAYAAQCRAALPPVGHVPLDVTGAGLTFARVGLSGERQEHAVHGRHLDAALGGIDGAT